jgi:hypothetical protein
MIYLIYPEKDITLYERYPNRNTGIDPILEVTKYTANQTYPDGTVQANTYNSRALLQFNVTEVSNSIVSGQIGGDATFHLSLRAIDSSDLPISYSLVAYPVSESWTNGNGNFNDDPETTNGGSWYYRDGKDVGTSWQTSSWVATSTGSWVTTPGGSTWYTSSYASQSFNYVGPDVRMDVTNIVHTWLSGSIVNNGFVIKRPDADESSSAIFGKLKFFGRDTHTIYVPRMEVSWNDRSFETGSLSELTDRDIALTVSNIRTSYKEKSKVRFRLDGRAMYPARTYATSSAYLIKKYLPTSSYWSVKDSETEETLIPFDNTATKISCDSDGNYFDVWMNAFMPERFYKFVFKIEKAGGLDTQFYDNGYYFKLVR